MQIFKILIFIFQILLLIATPLQAAELMDSDEIREIDSENFQLLSSGLPDPNPIEMISCLPSFLCIQRSQGRSIGSNSSYSSVEFFAFPFHFQSGWSFFDVKGHYFDNGHEYAANVGMGLRTVSPNCIVFGMNAYYDYRYFKHNVFNQLGLGVEVLGNTWNFRLNGYLPIGKKNFLADSCLYDKYVGGYFILREDFIRSLKGVSFELESFIIQSCWADVYLEFGGYYYQKIRCNKKIYGTEYRISFKNCHYGILDCVVSHDNKFKTRVQIQWTLPFSLCGCEDPVLFQPVRRQDLIITNTCSLWTRNF